MQIATCTTKTSEKNLKILPDYENIRYSLKFSSKIKVFFRTFMNWLKIREKSLLSIKPQTKFYTRNFEIFLTIWPMYMYREFFPPNWISVKYQEGDSTKLLPANFYLLKLLALKLYDNFCNWLKNFFLNYLSQIKKCMSIWKIYLPVLSNALLLYM